MNVLVFHGSLTFTFQNSSLRPDIITLESCSAMADAPQKEAFVATHPGAAAEKSAEQVKQTDKVNEVLRSYHWAKCRADLFCYASLSDISTCHPNSGAGSANSSSTTALTSAAHLRLCLRSDSNRPSPAHAGSYEQSSSLTTMRRTSISRSGTIRAYRP